MQTVWKKLTKVDTAPPNRWIAVVLGALSALAMPLFLTFLGWLVQLLFVSKLNDAGTRVMPDHLNVGEWLQLASSRLSSDRNILKCSIALIAAICVVFAFERITLLFSRRSALKAAASWTIEVLERIFHQSRNLSSDQGLAGQKKAIRDLIQTDVPRVRDALTEWYRVFPRNLIQIIAVSLLASCVHLWLTLLAILTLIIIWGLYISLEASHRKYRPVLLEQRRNAHEHLIYLCESSPLLEVVDHRVDVGKIFDRQLSTYSQSQMKLADEGIGRSPALLITVMLLGAFFLFVLSVRVLEPSASLHIGDIVTLAGCVIVAVNGIFRLRRGFRRSHNANQSAENIARYLSITGTRAEPLDRGLSTKIDTRILFEHVSFCDSQKRRILDDVSLELTPGQVHAVVAIEPITAHTLGEMMLGFGLPSSGRILMDNSNLIDIDPSCIRKQSLLINERGPLLEGTVEENLWSGMPRDATIDIMDLARKSNVAEAILNLQDGIGTVVAENDERLTADHLYRIGIARAHIKKPSVIVAHEPPVRVSAQEEMDSCNAFLQLRSLRAFLIVLPERLSTLRNADKVFVFKDGRLAASGTHQALLEESEIYRHYNYLRFASA